MSIFLLSLEKKSMSFIKFIRILAPVRLKLSPVHEHHDGDNDDNTDDHDNDDRG